MVTINVDRNDVSIIYPGVTENSRKQTAIVLSIDSRPAYDHLHGQVMTIKDKRLAIEMLLMKQDIGSENVLVKWFPTDLMLVDGLTKLGAPMMLLRRVLREGRVILHENDEMTKWRANLKETQKLILFCCFCVWCCCFV